MNVALLEELLGLLKTLNETIGVPQGESIEDKNVLQGNNPSDPNKKVNPKLNSSERKRTTEIASLFAKTFFEYQKKKTPDTALKTSIQKITPKATQRSTIKQSEKSGSLLGGILALLGGAGALLLGLLTDGPFKGALKILSKLGIKGGIKMLMSGAKALLGTLSKFVTAPFRMVGKLFGKGIMGKMLSFMKPLLKILRRIPLIGSIISIGFAISRFMDGDNVGGVIDVLSALTGLLHLIPGGSFVAVPLSLGLDILNAWLDMKTAGAEDKNAAKLDLLGDMAKAIGGWIWKNADYIPVIGGIKRFGMAWEAFKSGNISEGLKELGHGFLGLTGVGPIVHGIKALMGFFGGEKESKGDMSPDSSWFSRFKGWVKKKLKDLPYVLRKPLEWFGILEDDGSGELDANFSKNMGDGYNKMKEFSSKTWDSVSQSFSNSFEWFKEKASTLWKAIPDAIGKSANWIADKFNGLTESFGKFITSISQKFEPAIDKIKKFLDEFVGKVVGWVKGLISFGGGEETPGLTEAQKSQRAKEAGYSSWEEYKKANWKWKGNTPEPTNTQGIMVNSGNQQSLEFLRNIGMTQIKIMGDIKVIAAQILKKMDGGMGGGSNTNISIPSQSQPTPQSSQISLNSNRGDYGSSAYALA